MLAIYLTPIIPDITGKIAQFFREEPFVWGEIDSHPLGCKVTIFRLFRLELEEQNIQNLFKEVQGMENSSLENIEKDMVSIEDFLKIKLKVGKILEAEDIPDSKTLRLKVDLGSEQRTIIAGIKSSYEPEDILNRYVIWCVKFKRRNVLAYLKECC